MSITQSFYDQMASQYHKLFLDWNSSSHEQAAILHRIFGSMGFAPTAKLLDCACGIGTQAIGLGKLGYNVTASDISHGALREAERKAAEAGVEISFAYGDFRTLSSSFAEKFPIIIAMDNALPHLLTREDLEKAVGSITEQLQDKGIFVGSIRDYDTLLERKPPYSPPYIHKTEKGQRVAFQTWDWKGDRYKLVQYIIEDGADVTVSRFECEYRATRRQELTELFLSKGCRKVNWLFPEETGYYQPIITVRK